MFFEPIEATRNCIADREETNLFRLLFHINLLKFRVFNPTDLLYKTDAKTFILVIKCSFRKNTFIASFAFVLQRLRAKPIPLRLRVSWGSLREGAGAVGDWGRARYNEVSANLKSRRLLPPLTRSPLPIGGRLSCSPIITQIGRENNVSANFYMSAISPLRITEKRQGVFLKKDPLEPPKTFILTNKFRGWQALEPPKTFKHWIKLKRPVRDSSIIGRGVLYYCNV